MRSIIDEIANAETEADQLRQDALTAARERVVWAKSEAEKQWNIAEVHEREETRNALLAADREGALLAESILSDMRETTKAYCEAADKKMDEAVSYLLEKVQGIA